MMKSWNAGESVASPRLSTSTEPKEAVKVLGGPVEGFNRNEAFDADERHDPHSAAFSSGANRQAARWPAVISRNSGSAAAQAGSANTQRG